MSTLTENRYRKAARLADFIESNLPVALGPVAPYLALAPESWWRNLADVTGERLPSLETRELVALIVERDAHRAVMV